MLAPLKTVWKGKTTSRHQRGIAMLIKDIKTCRGCARTAHNPGRLVGDDWFPQESLCACPASQRDRMMAWMGAKI